MIRIDPDSKIYQPYMAECMVLKKWYIDEEKKIVSKYPYTGSGKNIAHERAMGELRKELGCRLKELQIKYGYREKLP